MKIAARLRGPLRIMRNRARNFCHRLRAASYTLRPAAYNREVRFELGRRVNTRWQDDDRGYTITARYEQIIDPGQPIFTMGSCFAREINHELSQRDFRVYPDYRGLQFDTDEMSIGESQESRTIIHYDTFTIRQEFELAFGERDVGDEEIYERHSRSSNPFGTDRYCFDPLRKSVCGVGQQQALHARELANECIQAGVHQAHVYVLTLGLIECWRNTKTGSFVWGASLGRKSSLGPHLEFHLASFEENCANLRRICQLIFHHYPGRKIILTVSPVSMVRTFTDQDIVVANTESKSQLRAAAGQIRREFPNVYYWPSFEIATRQDIYCEDGRHVSREGVRFIIDNFLRAHARQAA